MEDKSKNNKPSFSPEQLKQLLALKGDLANNQNKRVIISQKLLIKITKIIQDILYYLDRFINYTTKKTDSDRNEVLQVARSPILFGTYVIIFLVLIGGVWSSCAPLNSAAVAIGFVVPSSNKKLIQHQEGGIISKIYVAQGDKVKEGDKLIELEDTKVKSQYESILSQYRHALAAESRLIAERDSKDKIEFPEFLVNDISLPEVARIIHTQENLFQSKKEVYNSEKEALSQRIESLKAKKVASVKGLEVAQDRLKAMNALHQKGFAHKAALLQIEEKVAGYKSEVASTNHAITENEIAVINLQNKYTEKTLTELKDSQAQVAHLKEQYIALKDSLNRIVIKSPVDGIVNSLNVHTIGGVIGSAPIMEISPIHDNLIIEARVPNRYIDSVHEGLKANIRFSAFKSRTTPTFSGKVMTISPDIISQDRNGPQQEPFYLARIEIDMDEFNKFAKPKNLELHPGMQAEVQIITGSRTLLRYMLDPITDTMFRSFKEK